MNILHTTGLRDLKYLPAHQQQREIRRRALWLATGALGMLAALLAIGIPGRMDFEDALRLERLERERQHVQAVKAAYHAGFEDGTARVLCQGLKRDRLTGEAIK